MILWAFKPHTVETEQAWTNAPLRAWRWTIQLEWCSLSVAEQVKFPDHDWYDIRPYSISFWRRWIWGVYHCYYDGPNCSVHIGFLHINWTPDECEKCFPRCCAEGICSLHATEERVRWTHWASRLPRWVRKLFRLERYSRNWNRVRLENVTPEYIAKIEAELTPGGEGKP